MPQIDLSILNQRQTPAFYADVFANRPAAGFIGRIFVSTNTFEFYRDNGTGWDLIGGTTSGTITGSGVAGQVSYWDGTNTIAGNNNLFYDTALSHLGINTNTPGSALDVHDDQSTLIQLNQTNSSNDTRIGFQNSGVAYWRIGSFYNGPTDYDFGIYDAVSAAQSFLIKKTTGQVLIGTTTVGSGKLVLSSAASDNGIQIVGANAPSLRLDDAVTGATKRVGLGIATVVNNFIQGSADRNFCIFNGSTTASPILFGIYDAGLTNVQEAARISAARNFLIGTTTDNGLKLQVSGSTFISTSLGIGTASLANYNLRIGANITGAITSYGILIGGIIQSDVTSSAFYNRTTASTVAASFTLGTLNHYYASQGTIGAGSTVTTQAGFTADSTLSGATNNLGFRGAISIGTGRFNLYMDGTAENYIRGNTGIGVSQSYISSGPILTNTLTNGGSGYVDGTYTDVAATNVNSTGNSALYTVIVSGGIVTSATLIWGGIFYKVGDTLTVSNTLLGGTGSGLIITVVTVDSSILSIANPSGADISLFRSDTSVTLGENLGTIKWLSNDTTIKASGLQAEIGAFGAGTAGGAYLSFFTRSTTAGTSLVEAMRIGSDANVGIGATSINASAKLQVDSTTQGFLPPRMTLAQKNAIGSPAEGLIVYQTDGTAGLYIYSGAAWKMFTIL